MTKFQRPDHLYTPKFIKNNINKYQKDRDAIPKVPINASKIDADFNCVYDAVEEIWQLNLDKKYLNLPDVLKNLDASINKNAKDIISVSATGILSPTRANVAYISKDGVNVITDKIDADIIKDNAINNQHLSQNCIKENNIADYSVTNNKISNLSITNEKITQNLLSNFTLTNNIELQDQIAIADNSDTNKNAKISFANFVESLKRLFGTAAIYNIGTGADNIVKLDSNGKLPAVDGSNIIGIAPRSLQVIEGKNLSTIYQADSDGFVIAYVKILPPLIQNGGVNLTLSVGNTNSSLSEVAIASIFITPSSQYANTGNSFCVPIRKNSFYRININQLQTSLTIETRILFMPFK